MKLEITLIILDKNSANTTYINKFYYPRTIEDAAQIILDDAANRKGPATGSCELLFNGKDLQWWRDNNKWDTIKYNHDRFMRLVYNIAE